jgi:SAM-dependent methyltransferase
MIDYYQTIPELNIKGRMDTSKEFSKIGLPKDLTNKSVLDIGCNIGAFLIEAKLRGARNISGVESNFDWRILAKGIMVELNIDEFNGVPIYKSVEELTPFSDSADVVLLLSVTHVIEEMTGQDILDKAYKLTKYGGLLIVEINDRLQKQELVFPPNGKLFGKNKDNRSVWHFYKQ